MNKPPKISVKHFLNKKAKGDQTLHPIYYYITIKRRTITKPSAIGYATESDFESGKYNAQMNKEVEELTAICEKYIADEENNCVNKSLSEFYTKEYITRRNYNSQDDFVNGLNMYIELYMQPFVELLTGAIEGEIKAALNEKFVKLFNCRAFAQSINWSDLGIKEQHETDLNQIAQNVKTALLFFEQIQFLRSEPETLFCFDNVADEDLLRSMYIIAKISTIIQQWQYKPTMIDYYNGNLLADLTAALNNPKNSTPENYRFIDNYKPIGTITADHLRAILDSFIY